STPAQIAARNALGLLLGTIGEGVLQFVFVVLVSRYLGPDDFGFWGFSVAVTGYLLVAASFGLPQIIVREIAKTPLQAPQIFGAAMGLRLLLGVAIWIVLAAVLPLFGVPFDRHLTLLILSVALLLMPFDLASFFDAHQKSRWDAFFRVIARAISVGALGLILLSRNRLTLPLAACVSIAFLLCNIGLAWTGIRYLRLSLRPQTTLSGMRQMFTLALPIFWARAMSELYVHTNLVLMGFLSTDRQTGYYAVADRVLVILLTLKAIVYRLLLPLLSEVVADRERLTKRLETVIPFLAQMSILGATTIILVADPMVPLIFGDAFSPAVTPLRILTGYLILTGVGSIFGTVLFAMGRQREYSISITVGSLANLLLGLFMIPFYGAVGAAVSSAIAEILVLCASFVYFRRYLRPIFLMSVLHVLAAAAVMAMVYSLAPFGGSWAFVGKLLFSLVAAVAVLWLTGELGPPKTEILRQLIRR
ncbi:MAG: flippase, partial [Calditrichaeota bacterium]|nr:flippase [Calditrichota bacterium]